MPRSARAGGPAWWEAGGPLARRNGGRGGAPGPVAVCSLRSGISVFRFWSTLLLLPASALCGWKGVNARSPSLLAWTLFTSLLTHRLVLHCVDAHCFIFWDLLRDVLAAPEAALCGWIAVILLFLSLLLPSLLLLSF